MSEQTTILILAADPSGAASLILDQELRDIREGLQRAKDRDRFKLITHEAVRTSDLRQAILEENPDIVHFTIGGDRSAIILENATGAYQKLSAAALGALFELADPAVTAVVMNGCYDPEQAGAISAHTEFVLGIKGFLPPESSRFFALGFYDALGAGLSYEKACNSGRLAVELENIPVGDAHGFHHNTRLTPDTQPVPDPTPPETSDDPLNLANHHLTYGEIGKAIEVLLAYAEQQVPDDANSVRAVSGRWYSLQKRILEGTIREADAELTRNQIIRNLTAIIGQFKSRK